MGFKKMFLSVVVVAWIVAVSGPALAFIEPFVVNDAGDGADENLSDSVCEATDGMGDCTLRAAIQEATAQEARVEFNIPGSGPHVIAQASNLPEVHGLRIDATTQPGFSGKPLVVLDGRQYSSLVQYGLKLTGSASVHGLAIQGFQNYGIFIVGGGVNIVQSCTIGTDAEGTGAVGNGYGINIQADSPGNSIGGGIAGLGNVISGNADVGLSLGLSNDNVVKGNHIGTDASGGIVIPNGGGGLSFSGSNNTIGGEEPDAANTISGNTGFGVRSAASQFNFILGNVIASNTEEGIVLTAGSYNNKISKNSIYGNGGLGIDLGEDGVTANDAGDADDGPNVLQNFPIIDSALSNGCDGVGIEGVLPAYTNQPFYIYRLEFFKSGEPDASGYGEGRTFLGDADVTADLAGNAAFSITVPGATLGDSISATATEPYGSTSEFSAAVEVTRNDDPGTVAFVSGSVSVSESSETVAIEIQRSCGSAGSVAVDAKIADGSAIAGSDYEPLSQTVAFADGESAKTVSIPILDDALDEGDETLTLSLSNPAGTTLGGLSSVIVTITDDDESVGATTGGTTSGETTSGSSGGGARAESSGGCGLITR